MPPSAAAASSMYAAIAAASPRSQQAACAGRPWPANSSRVAASAAAPRAQIDTAAPAWAKPSAIARPMPLLPPATTTRQPRKSNGEAIGMPASAPEMGETQSEHQCGDQEEHRQHAEHQLHVTQHHAGDGHAVALDALVDRCAADLVARQVAADHRHQRADEGQHAPGEHAEDQAHDGQRAGAGTLRRLIAHGVDPWAWLAGRTRWLDLDVMPAKAGIHVALERVSKWMPACPGMTSLRAVESRGLQVELDPLRQRQRVGVVDGVGLAAHVDLPCIRAGLATAAGFLLAAERAADLRARGADVDV